MDRISRGALLERCDVNNRFVFIVPAYNAADTIARTILSVWMQTYSNWKILIRDDMSTDNTVEVVANIQNYLGISDEKILVEINKEKKWEVRNIIELFEKCEPSDIVCRLDGDDWLCDTDALSIINHRYETLGVDALWTAHRWSFTNYNISGPLPKNADPYTHPWVSSHLKTFRKNLIEGILDENFRGSDGNYFKRIGDQAIYLPALYRAAGNWHYEPIVAYHYTIEMNTQTFQTEDSKFQRSEGELLRARGFLK